MGDDAEPEILWRRVAGTEVVFSLAETQGMGIEDETVIRVGVRYNYQSVLTDLFGGGFMAIEKIGLRPAAYRTKGRARRRDR